MAAVCDTSHPLASPEGSGVRLVLSLSILQLGDCRNRSRRKETKLQLLRLREDKTVGLLWHDKGKKGALRRPVTRLTNWWGRRPLSGVLRATQAACRAYTERLIIALFF